MAILSANMVAHTYSGSVVECLTRDRGAVVSSLIYKKNFVWFDFILYVPSIIFQLKRDGSSLVEPVLS